MMKKNLIGIAVVLILVSAIPTVSPAQSIELDKTLGEENAKMVAAQMGIYEDHPKTEFIRSVGNRLLDQLPNKLFEFEFHIVPEMAPNAFALPGGYVFITTGLLPLIETEDELACIMAHEIIHAQNRHSIKQLKKSILPRLLEVPGNLIGVLNKDLGAIFNAPIQTSNALLMASYGRGFETESDIEGVKLAAAAGYDPNAMIPVLSRMSAAIEKATGQQEAKSYFNDHPYTPDRVKTIEQNTARLKWTQQNGNSGDFLMEFDSLLFGDHPNKGIIRENKFLHPDLDFSVTFPKDWSIENQPTNVGAYHPGRKAAAYVSLENAKLSPEQAGQLVVNSLEPEYKRKMTGAAPYKFNGKDGYLLSFEERAGSVTMYAYILWLPLEDKLFKMTGIAPIEYRPDLEEVAKSLRKLNKAEKKSFTINLVRVEQANKGESIKTLSERTKNLLNEELTAVINSRGIYEPLDAGEEVKVVKQYPYHID